jgi:hypothetical protein
VFSQADPNNKSWARTVTRRLRDVAPGQIFRYGPLFREIYGEVARQLSGGLTDVSILDSSIVKDETHPVAGLRSATLEASLEVEIPYQPVTA